MTKYSSIILDIINNSYNHPTAEDIYIQLKNQNMKIVLATVYNNLNYLVDNGYIKAVKLDDNAVHYDRIEKHDHLVCQKCHKITDVKLDNLSSLIEKQLGQNILDYQLTIDYICDDCKNNSCKN